jgi:hypothetical protein
MGDAIERARQKVHDQIAAREGRTSSGEQSASDRASYQDRQEHMPATENQNRREERQRQFDAERNKPSPNEQAENRKATQDYMAKQRKKERHEEFENQRELERKTREGAAKAREDEDRRKQREEGTTAKEFRERAKRNAEQAYRTQHVDPMLPFGEFVKKKATGVKNEFVKRTKDSFTSEIAYAKDSVQGGRERRRRIQQEDPFDSFWGTPPPAPYRPQRKSAPMGTGFLFSEGFLNPPKGKTGRKRKGTATPRRSFGMGDMLL